MQTFLEVTNNFTWIEGLISKLQQLLLNVLEDTSVLEGCFSRHQHEYQRNNEAIHLSKNCYELFVWRGCSSKSSIHIQAVSFL